MIDRIRIFIRTASLLDKTDQADPADNAEDAEDTHDNDLPSPEFGLINPTS
jgi:hypothetical protein